MSALETSGIIKLLEPYHSNLIKRIVKTPKLYFLNIGLAAFLTGWDSSNALKCLKKNIGHGAVICLREGHIPLSQNITAINVGYL